MDSPGFLAGAVGEGSHHRFSYEESLGGLSAADVHDAGRGGGGGEPGERMASVAASRTAVAMEGQALAQGDGVRAAAAAAPTNTGTSMFPISTCRARSITCAA